MDRLNGGAGRDPELVSEQESKPLVGEQRFGNVAAPLERFHEDAVPGLAIRGECGQHPGAFLRLRQCRAAEAEAGGRKALQPAQPDLRQPAPPLVDPGRLQPGEEGPGGDVVGDPGRTPRLGPASRGDAGLGPVGALQGGLDVDEGRLRQQQLYLRPPLELVVAYGRAAASIAAR